MRLFAAAVLLFVSTATSALPNPAQYGLVLDLLYLRAGPSVGYRPLAIMPPGQPVLVYGCERSLKWCDVAFGSHRGWAYRRYIGPYRFAQARPAR